MADSAADSIEAIEKLIQIPSSDAENSKSFIVESCKIQSTVTGLSSFGVAIKFV